MNNALYYRTRSFFSTPWLTAILLLFAFFGCKKKNIDEKGPQIAFEQPTAGSTFNYLDEIPISASVKDETTIERIQVQITNSSNQSFLQTIEYNEVVNDKQIHTFISHDDLYLNSGVYYVKITATDGENESIAFREIILTEAPTVLKHVYVIHGNDSQTIIDTVGNAAIASFLTLPFGYDMGEINSRYNIMLMNHEDRMYILNADTGTELYNEFHNTSDVTETVFDKSNNSIYTGTVDGYVFKTDRYGLTSIFSYQPNQTINNLLVSENYVFVDMTNLPQTIRSLNVFQKNTGAFVQSIQVDFDMKEIIDLGNENLFLLVGNENGEGVLKYYNRQTNFFNSVFTFYNHSIIHDAWPTANNQFIVSHEDGLIAYSNDLQMQPTGIDLQPMKLVHEKLSGLNYAVKENGVYVLNTNATQQISFYPISDCKDVLLLYNK